MRVLEVGTHVFLEVSGASLREAARTAVIAAREDAAEAPFDVTVRARRGHRVLTKGDDEAWIAAGIGDAYAELAGLPTVVGASDQVPPSDTVLVQPAMIEVRQATSGDPLRYEISFMVTSDGRTRGHLFQETKATLNPSSWTEFLRAQVTPALAGLPRPFRVAVAVGGTSAEASLRTAARADARELDHLGEEGDERGTPIRLREMETELTELLDVELGGATSASVCSQARIIRLVRHGGSLPIGLYAGLPSDRRIRAILTPGGLDVTPSLAP